MGPEGRKWQHWQWCGSDQTVTATANPMLRKVMYPVSGGDKVGADASDEDFMPYLCSGTPVW